MNHRGVRKGCDPSFYMQRNPLDCEALIVGINAASDVPFWRFWNDEKGFDKTGWYACYRAMR